PEKFWFYLFYSMCYLSRNIPAQRKTNLVSSGTRNWIGHNIIKTIEKNLTIFRDQRISLLRFPWIQILSPFGVFCFISVKNRRKLITCYLRKKLNKHFFLANCKLIIYIHPQHIY
ncbi:hypothetical protein ACJX0J_006146, partial [Zea mays]